MSSLRDNYGKVSNTKRVVLRHATDDGDPEGGDNANVNGSVTPVMFYVQPILTETFDIHNIEISVSDSGNTGLNDYGGVSGPLTNGIVFFVELEGIFIPIGIPIKTNRELINLSESSETHEFAGSTFVKSYRFGIAKFGEGIGIILHGKHLDKFGILVQDDLTTLINHNLSINGNAITQL